MKERKREKEKTGNTVSPRFASTYFKCYTGYPRLSHRVFSTKDRNDKE